MLLGDELDGALDLYARVSTCLSLCDRSCLPIGGGGTLSRTSGILQCWRAYFAAQTFVVLVRWIGWYADGFCVIAQY